MTDWLRDHALELGILSAATFVAGLIAVPILVGRMRADYFLVDQPPEESWRGHHPALRLFLIACKNFLGYVLIVAGIVMVPLPGQGILTILIGLGLVNFPGKRAAELFLVRRRPVHGLINWLRKRAGQPPLELP